MEWDEKGRDEVRPHGEVEVTASQKRTVMAMIVTAFENEDDAEGGRVVGGTDMTRERTTPKKTSVLR